jgi:transposase-like protein
MDENSLKLLLAQGVSVEEIGRRFGRHPSTISYWMEKFGLEAPNREKHAAKGGIDRNRLEEMVNRGMTIAEIAAEVGLSKTTVRHWLKRYQLRTHNKVGPRVMKEAKVAKEAGMLTMLAECRQHGETSYILEGRGYYRCQRCRVEQIARHRRKLKETLVADAGGRCQACGYDGCIGALQFHHVDRADKRMGISAGGLTQSLQALRLEAAKCVLLCANCHAEVERGIRVLALQ